MRLQAATDFALRTAMRLASEPERHFSTEMLAGELAVSHDHLQQAVQSLAEGGFVRILPGTGGGILLAHPPEHIRVGEILRWFEETQPAVECFQDEPGHCPYRFACRTKSMLVGAQEAFFGHLERFTLADCIAGGAVFAPYPQHPVAADAAQPRVEFS